MIVLSALWDAFVWLPAPARVLLAAFLWVGFSEVIGKFAGFNARFDEELDKPRREQRDAMVRPLPRDQRRRLGTVR